VWFHNNGMVWVSRTHLAVIAVQDELEARQQIRLLVDIIQRQSCGRHARLSALPSSLAGYRKDASDVQLIGPPGHAPFQVRRGDQTKQKYPKRNSTITCHILQERTTISIRMGFRIVARTRGASNKTLEM